MSSTRALILACCLAGCSFEHGAVSRDAAPDAPPTTATLFVADYGAGQLFRLQLTQGADPVVTLSLPLPGALSPVYLPVTGELLVGELSNPQLDRFATPLETPTLTGTIMGVGIEAGMAKTRIVDGELWVTNPGDNNVDRLVFDTAGAPSMVADFGLVNGRGLAYAPATHDVYVAQCCSINVIQHYVVQEHVVTTKSPTTDNGLSNPHGLIVLPWSELLVANLGDSKLLRFSLDTAGTPIANGEIVSSDLAAPIDFALTPWGELYVTNLANGTLARFTFDEAHAAVAGGTFAIPGASMLVWTALVP